MYTYISACIKLLLLCLCINELFRVCVSWYSDDCSLHKVHYNLSLSDGGGRHNRETLYKDTLLWFYRKLIFLQRKNKIIQRSIQCRSRRPVTTILLSQILLVSSLFLLSIIFWRKGSIKLFITDKDEFIAEKMCWEDWPGKVEHQRLQTRLSWSWTWIKMGSGAVSPCISSRNTGELELQNNRQWGNKATRGTLYKWTLNQFLYFNLDILQNIKAIKIVSSWASRFIVKYRPDLIGSLNWIGICSKI